MQFLVDIPQIVQNLGGFGMGFFWDPNFRFWKVPGISHEKATSGPKTQIGIFSIASIDWADNLQLSDMAQVIQLINFFQTLIFRFFDFLHL